MANADQSRDRYDEARRNFDGLDVEERARFLVEATASTVAHGLLQASEALADGLEEAIRRARRRSARRSGKQGAGPAEPETAQRQAPRTGSRDPGPDA